MRTNENGFCLKMMPCECGSGGGKAPDLSAEEQEAGFRDKNGNKVYVKTIEFTNSSTHMLFPHNIANVAAIVDYRYTADAGNGWAISGNYYLGSGHYFRLGVGVTEVETVSQPGNSIEIALTIYYTCTDR